MKQEKIIMGMTIKIEIADANIQQEIFEKLFAYFEHVDRKFSTFKADSEISKINAGLVSKHEYSEEMREVFALAEDTKKNTNGYFDIKTPQENIDPSGIVKGWAIKNAAKILKDNGYNNFYIDAGGDIEAVGINAENKPWNIGIRNPFKIEEVVKIVRASNAGVATSGNYVHKTHIYNPKNANTAADIVSLTVVGPDIYEADRFATAAFAMGRDGINFIESQAGLEAYMIDAGGIATMTSGFGIYTE